MYGSLPLMIKHNENKHYNHHSLFKFRIDRMLKQISIFSQNAEV